MIKLRAEPATFKIGVRCLHAATTLVIIFV